MKKIFVLMMILFIASISYGEDWSSLEIVKDEFGNLEKVSTIPFRLDKFLQMVFVFYAENNVDNILLGVLIDVDDHFPIDKLHTIEAINMEGNFSRAGFSYANGVIYCLFDSPMLLKVIKLGIGYAHTDFNVPLEKAYPLLQKYSLLKDYINKNLKEEIK